MSVRPFSKSVADSGFTLVELLVVIAIIAILAVILFPVFSTAREKARQSTCASNERQLGLGFLQYMQDYDEMFPGPIATTGSWPSAGAEWCDEVYPYVRSTSVYDCPSDPTLPTGTNGVDKPISYAFNVNLPNIQNGVAKGSIVDLTTPPKTVLLAEIEGWGANNTIVSAPQWTSPVGYGFWGLNEGPHPCLWATGYLGAMGVTGPSYYLAPTGVHSGGSNFLLCDGHVKWLPPTLVSPGYNASGPNKPEQTNNYAAGTNGTINGVPAAATFSEF